MASTRIQIYLTTEQRERLDALGSRQGRPLAALIRDAVDDYLERSGPDPTAALDRTFGIAPDFEIPSREGWDEREQQSAENEVH